MSGPVADAPREISLTALFLRFLGFGCQAFGGPVAQIAMLRQALVAEDRWVSPERFNRLLAVMQVLPGPEAHELSVHLGMIKRGRLGGLLAGLGFMLPGFALMVLAAWAYVRFVAGAPELAGVLLGVQVAVLAVIVRAVWRIGGHVLTVRDLVAIAAIALLATLAGVPFWLMLAGAAVAGVPGLGRWVPPLLMAALAVAAFALLPRTTSDAVPVALATAPTVSALFVAGLKGGLLTFGGAYTAIPYVRADTVGRGWLSDATFLDGVAIGGMLPAPLVIFATFVGYVAGGFAGAVAITLGMFLPAFAFSLVLYERLERLIDDARLHRLLDAVAAAAVGIIGATVAQLGYVTARAAEGWVPWALFAVALVAAWRLKGGWVAPLLVAIGALTGWAVLG